MYLFNWKFEHTTLKNTRKGRIVYGKKIRLLKAFVEWYFVTKIVLTYCEKKLF